MRLLWPMHACFEMIFILREQRFRRYEGDGEGGPERRGEEGGAGGGESPGFSLYRRRRCKNTLRLISHLAKKSQRDTAASVLSMYPAPTPKPPDGLLPDYKSRDVI